MWSLTASVLSVILAVYKFSKLYRPWVWMILVCSVLTYFQIIYNKVQCGNERKKERKLKRNKDKRENFVFMNFLIFCIAHSLNLVLTIGILQKRNTNHFLKWILIGSQTQVIGPWLFSKIQLCSLETMGCFSIFLASTDSWLWWTCDQVKYLWNACHALINEPFTAEDKMR